MKNLLSLLVLLVAVATVSTAQSGSKRAKKVDGPKMTVETKVLDLGEVVQQTAPLDGKFVFKNTGNSDLVITGAKGSCGCTIPKFTKEPVQPGSQGEISFRYTKGNILGNFAKTIRVTTNETREVEENGQMVKKPVTTILTIKGKIVKEANFEKKANGPLVPKSGSF